MGKFGNMTRPQLAWYLQRNRKRRLQNPPVPQPEKQKEGG